MTSNLTFQRHTYFFLCFLVIFFTTGCKERGLKITVFDGLPESKYLNEAMDSIKNKKPVVVAFLAEWCPHCRRYKPIFQEVGDFLNDSATFVHIDVDGEEGSNIVNRFHVKGIPTTAFVRVDGSVYKVHVGALEKDDLAEIVKELVKNKKKKRKDPVAPFPIESQIVEERKVDEDLIKEPEDKEITEDKKDTEESEPSFDVRQEVNEEAE